MVAGIGGLEVPIDRRNLGGAQGEELGTKIFSLRLTCVLAGIMLLLSALIVIDALRRWYGLPLQPATRAEPQPALEE